MLTLNLINNITRSFSYIYYGIGFFINLFFNNKFRKNLLICFYKYNILSTTQQQQQQQTAQHTHTGQQTAT